MPQISVIVPVYNVEEFLPQALDAILLQTFLDFEVICVNDGSTDGSLEILQTYAMFDERVKIISQKNSGVAAARNRAIQNASGEYIVCLDPDDFFEPDMLERMLAKAKEDDSDIVVTGHYIFDNATKQTVKEINIDEQFLEKSPFRPEDFEKELFELRKPASWNKLVRTSVIRENKISFDEDARCMEDVCYECLCLACAKKISVIKDAFVHYRRNVAQSLTFNRKDYFQDFLVAMEHLYQRLKELKLETFIDSYVLAFKQICSYMFSDMPHDQKAKNVLLIRKILSKENLDVLFPSFERVKVSIIIPVYNCAEYLPECLDSCINQTLKEIEIICVDDGSTDESLSVLQKYAQKDARVTVLQQENQRQAIARNLAMTLASGQYVQFLDADDYMENYACECLYLYSEIFRLDMCQCTAIEFYNHNRKEFENPYHCLTWLQDKNLPCVFNKWGLQGVLPHMAVTAWLTFYNRTFLIKNNISWINKKIPYEDTPFFVESILKATRVGAIKAPLYHRRVHSAATTQQMANNFNEYMWILKYTLDMTKNMAEPDIHLIYCYVFLEKAFLNFAALEPTDKLKMAAHLYDFCCYILKKQRLPLSKDVYAWCLRYIKSLSKTERFKFKFYTFLAKCIRREYTINFCSMQVGPAFCLKIFGLPIIKKVIQEETQTKDEIKSAVFHKNIFVKVFGVTILKIKEICNV